MAEITALASCSISCTEAITYDSLMVLRGFNKIITPVGVDLISKITPQDEINDTWRKMIPGEYHAPRQIDVCCVIHCDTGCLINFLQ